MQNHKRTFLASDDRISNLSEDLINSILDRLPVQDAVRTSILSKEWRYRWTTMRALVFDHRFSQKFTKNGAFGRNGFIRIINQLVFLHKGPILKFSLHIPTILYLDSFQEIDQWMLFLSRNSVRELRLVLTNWNRRYPLPSYVFSFLELKKLNLASCIFKPPLEFEGFLNLEHLILQKVDFRANSCGTLATLPQLKRLYLESCTNVYNLNIEARTLRKLIVIACPDALLPRLLDSPCLTTVFLSLQKPIEAFAQVGRMNLVNLLSNNLDRAKNEYFIAGHFLKFLSAEEIRKWLPHAVNLWLIHFQLADLDELRGAFCLLRNSPNLESLIITHARMEPQVIHNDVRPASNHLEYPDCLDLTFYQLETVEIKTFGGSRPELLFIKLLLAHSPSLQKMTIEPIRTSDVHKRFDIAKDVMRFSRASPEAEIIFLDPKP